MRTLTHVSVSPTIVTGRLHERGGRGDGEPTIYIIVASSLGTHTFVFIGRRRGGKATDGIFGPVRPEILRWEDRISFYFAFTSFSSPSRHHFLAFLRRFFYHFSSRRYQEIHRARPQHPRHGFGNQGEWVTNVQQVDTRAPLCTRTLGDLKFRSIRRDTLSLSLPPSFSLPLFLLPFLSSPWDSLDVPAGMVTSVRDQRIRYSRLDRPFTLNIYKGITYLQLFPIKPTYREYRSHNV